MQSPPTAAAPKLHPICERVLCSSDQHGAQMGKQILLRKPVQSLHPLLYSKTEQRYTVLDASALLDTEEVEDTMQVDLLSCWTTKRGLTLAQNTEGTLAIWNEINGHPGMLPCPSQKDFLFFALLSAVLVRTKGQ